MRSETVLAANRAVFVLPIAVRVLPRAKRTPRISRTPCAATAVAARMRVAIPVLPIADRASLFL